jgi:hypothetical protein
MASFLFRWVGRPKTSCRAGQDMPLAVYRFPVGSGMGLTGIVKGVPRYTPQAGAQLHCVGLLPGILRKIERAQGNGHEQRNDHPGSRATLGPPNAAIWP